MECIQQIVSSYYSVPDWLVEPRVKLEEEDSLRLGNLVGITVEEDVLRRESCDAGHAVLRHVGPYVSAGGIIQGDTSGRTKPPLTYI